MKKSLILTALLLTFPTATFALNLTSLTSLLSKESPPTTLKKGGVRMSLNKGDQNLENIAKNITVRVIGDASKGSGTIIAKQGNNYLILTNYHVVRLSNKLQIQTPDGVNHQAKLISNANQKKLDLALLQITTNNNYTVANLASELPKEGTQILSSGFPIETGKLKIITGEINRISANAFKEGYQIGFKGDMDIGMSGGAILNENGEIIGINGRKAYPVLNTGFVYEDETKPNDTEIQTYRTLNWGIPLTTFFAQLNPEIITTYKLPQVTPIVATNTNTNTNNNLLETVFPPITYTGKVAELEQKAKQFSVKIDGFGQENTWINNGSGVIIAKEGDTYYVLTAFHVVKNYIERETINTIKEFKEGNIEYKYKITAPDGKVYEVDNTKVKAEEGVDLAVVQFKSKENYGIATLANYRVSEDDYTLAAGYPNFSENNSPWRFTFGYIFEKETGLLRIRNKDYQFQSSSNLTSPSEVSPSAVSLPIVTLKEGYELVYTSMTLGGMSGGAVLDIEGRVIGIHGRGEGSSQEDVLIGNSLGIPISTFLGMTNRLGVKPPQISTEKPKLSENEKKVINETILKADFGSDNTTAKNWMYRGNQLWRLKRYDEAIKAFDEAIKQKPDFIHLAYYGKALAFYGKGLELKETNSKKFDESLQALQKAIESKPDFVAALLLQAKIYDDENLKQYEEALKVINQAIQLDAKNPNLLVQKSWILSDLERYEEAVDTITIAIKLAPRSIFYRNRANVYVDLGEYQKALDDCNTASNIDPNNIYTYLTFSLIYIDSKEYDKALANYNQAIKLDGNNNMLYRLRGILYFLWLKDYDKALVDLNKAISIDDKDVDTYRMRALFYLSKKEDENALVDLNQAIFLDKNNVDAYERRGGAYFNLKKYNEAIADLTRVIELDDKNIFAYAQRGGIYFLINEYEKALAGYNQAINLEEKRVYRSEYYISMHYQRSLIYGEMKEYQKVIDDLTKVIDFGKNIDNIRFAKSESDQKRAVENVKNYIYLPFVHSFYEERGDAYLKLKEYEKAIEDFSQVVSINQDVNSVTNAYQKMGTAYEKLKEYQKAIYNYTQAIKLDGNNALRYGIRGGAYEKLKEYDKAIADYTKFIEIKPDDAQGYILRGSTYFQLKEYDKARDDFTRWIEIKPDDAEGYNFRGGIYVELKEYDKAFADFNYAIKIKPDDAQGYSFRGEAYLKLKEYDKALADYNTLIKINPDLAEAYFGKGIVYHQQGNYNQALTEYNLALSKNSELLPAIANIGMINYEMGNKNKAFESWQQVLKIDPKNAEIMLAMGVYWYSEGKTEEGLKLAKEALEIDKNFGDVEYLKNNLWSDKLISDAEKLFKDLRGNKP